jgi:hypothetical protein
MVYESDFKRQIGNVNRWFFVDLLDDFNNEEVTLTQKLLEWTANGGMHCTEYYIKFRGENQPHIGSSILKKPETGIFMAKMEQQNSQRPLH